MWIGWERVRREDTEPAPGGFCHRTPARRCKGPDALFAIHVSALEKDLLLTFRVLTRALYGKNWVLLNSVGTASSPSQSVVSVEGLQHEYRFEFELVGHSSIGVPAHADIYENWRRRGRE